MNKSLKLRVCYLAWRKWDVHYEMELYRKIHCLTSEFHVQFHAKNRYRTNREAS